MSRSDSSSDDGEFETAIGAAAFAIIQLEEESLFTQEKPAWGSETSLTRTKSRREDIAEKLPDFGRLTRQPTGKETKWGEQSAGEGWMRKPDAVDKKMPENASADQMAPEKTWDTFPTIGKNPTFTEKYQDNEGRRKSESAMDVRPTPNAPSTLKPTVSMAGDGRTERYSAVPKKEESKAEAWKNAQMAKIKKRYDETNSMILSWENEKKDKAKRRKDKAEKKMDRKRGNVLSEYNIEISNIEKIAGGSRAQAEERRRNEEAKTNEKASKIMSTGKDPETCTCC